MSFLTCLGGLLPSCWSLISIRRFSASCSDMLPIFFLFIISDLNVFFFPSSSSVGTHHSLDGSDAFDQFEEEDVSHAGLRACPHSGKIINGTE